MGSLGAPGGNEVRDLVWMAHSLEDSPIEKLPNITMAAVQLRSSWYYVRREQDRERRLCHLLAGDPALNRVVLEPLTPPEFLEQASGASFLGCVISAMAVLAEGAGLKGLGSRICLETNILSPKSECG